MVPKCIHEKVYPEVIALVDWPLAMAHTRTASTLREKELELGLNEAHALQGKAVALWICQTNIFCIVLGQ